MSDIAKKIGLRIRNYRMQRGISQEKLAELAGCHHTYIGQLERGEKNATIESILKVTTALNVSLSALFEKIEENSDSKNDSARNIPIEIYDLFLKKNIGEQELLLKIFESLETYKEKTHKY